MLNIMKLLRKGEKDPSMKLIDWFTLLVLSQAETVIIEHFHIKVLYMSSSFWLLGIESRDFSHAEKERTACKAEQIHKMRTIFTQNGPALSFWVSQ